MLPRRALLVLPLALAACDLHYPDHRIGVAGRVWEEGGAPAPGLTVTLRRERLGFDRVLASTETDGAGAYRGSGRLEGCSQLFDGFSVVAERVDGADTVRVRERAECIDESQAAHLVVPAAVPRGRITRRSSGRRASGALLPPSVVAYVARSTASAALRR